MALLYKYATLKERKKKSDAKKRRRDPSGLAFFLQV